jgi:hypothetical protein
MSAALGADYITRWGKTGSPVGAKHGRAGVGQTPEPGGQEMATRHAKIAHLGDASCPGSVALCLRWKGSVSAD